MTDRQTEAYDFFKSKGWSPVQAAAIVGHAMAESNLNPGMFGDNGAAFGVFQHNDRQPALLKYLRDKGLPYNDFRGQLEFAQHELDTSQGFAASQLRAAMNIEEATAAFMHFKRPQGYSLAYPMGSYNWAGRLANAKSVYAEGASYPSLGGGAVDTASVSASPSTAKVNWSDPAASRSPINDVEMNQYRAQQTEGVQPYGIGEALWRETKDAQTMTWLLRGQTDLLPDPEWSPSLDVLKAAQDGIPKHLQGQLGAATSEAHLAQLKAQILDDVEHGKRLSAMGWTGTGIRIGAAFTDIAGLGLTILAPEIGLPAKAGRLGAAGARAVEGAVINAALEVPRIANKPTAHGTDILWAAGAGAALGGAFGAIAGNRAVVEEAAALEGIGKGLRRHADAEDAAGRQLVTPTLPVTMGELGSTGGAMRTSPRETLTEGATDWAHAAVDEAVARSWGPKFRWDLAGKGKGSENAATRAFMGSTVTDVVGNADKSKVAGRTAEEFQKQVEFDYGMMADKAHHEGFTAYANRMEIPWGERTAAREAFNREVTAVIDHRLPGVGDFSPEAVATASKLRQGYSGLLELAKNPGLLDGSTRKAVKGFEEIPVDANYRPNIANHERIDSITTRFGDEAVRQFLASAFKAAARELPDAVAERMSKGYLRTLREATAGMTNLGRVVHGTDMEAIGKALGDMDLDDASRELVLNVLRPSPDKGGGIARSKRRALYDTNFEAQVRARDGSWETLRMKDFFHEDSQFLFRSYARQMSGQIAMSMVQVRNPLHHPELRTASPRGLTSIDWCGTCAPPGTPARTSPMIPAWAAPMRTRSGWSSSTSASRASLTSSTGRVWDGPSRWSETTTLSGS